MKKHKYIIKPHNMEWSIDEEGHWHLEDEVFGIMYIARGENMRAEFDHWIQFLINCYMLEKDEKLSEDAIKLKNKLKEYIELIG